MVLYKYIYQRHRLLNNVHNFWGDSFLPLRNHVSGWVCEATLVFCVYLWGFVQQWLTATSACACPWQQVSSSSEPSSGSTCCSSPEWSSTPEQCPQSYSSEGEYSSEVPLGVTRAPPPGLTVEPILVVCRSSECRRLSRAEEHALLDFYRGGHLCSWWTCHLFCGHSQIEPPELSWHKNPKLPFFKFWFECFILCKIIKNVIELCSYGLQARTNSSFPYWLPFPMIHRTLLHEHLVTRVDLSYMFASRIKDSNDKAWFFTLLKLDVPLFETFPLFLPFFLCEF